MSWPFFIFNFMILTIIILLILVVVLGFTTLNLLKKNEKCEDVIKSYENYMTNLSNTITWYPEANIFPVITEPR